MTAAKALHPLVLQTLAQHLAGHRRCQAWQPPVPAVPGGAKEISKSANTPLAHRASGALLPSRIFTCALRCKQDGRCGKRSNDQHR